MRLTISDARTVRHRIAAAVLDQPPVTAQLGRITLHDRQRKIASRLLSLIRENGGALLAEPVGLGKTYTALAVARALGDDFVVLAPAALTAMWRAALIDCDVTAAVVSHESMSRGVSPPSARLIVVDESHRFRTPSTRRYAKLAESCRVARTLLISATPIHNRASDLAAQLALFLGRRAWSMSEPDLTDHVVRGLADDGRIRAIPKQVGPIPIPIADDDRCLALIAALPPPIPAKDESVAAALLTYSLVHQWTSSRAALVEALRRRRTRGLAMLDVLDAGRVPTRGELAAWTHASDAMQLAFPELVVATSTSDVDRAALTVGIDRHLAGIDALLTTCRQSPDPDVDRADALRRICADHTGERVIAFCQYTETVASLRRHLSSMPGLAVLTARGALVATGRITRDAVLAQFSPRGDRPEVREAERISLLITTDLLSEGVNLQEASVVVHLDLPWNPARLEQRVGRIRRLGSRHDRISVFAFAPPASADDLLRIEARLRQKVCIAQRTIGVAGTILPSFVPATSATGIAEHRAEIDQALNQWLRSEMSAVPGMLVAGVKSSTPGFIAAIAQGHESILVVELDGLLRNDPQFVATALALGEGPAVVVEPSRVERAIARLTRFLEERRGTESIDIGVVAAGRSRREALSRVSRTLARTPRHRRAQLAPLVDAARAVATAPLGEGAERVLDQLVRAELPDEAWLRSIATFGQLNARQAAASSPPSDESVIVAVLLLQT